MNPRDAFLKRFFGDGNLIKADEVAGNAALQGLVESLTTDIAIPVVIPRRRSPADVDWFVLCGTDTTLRRVEAELQGFIGPTYGRWDRSALLDKDDPVESAVLDFADGRAIRFRTASEDEFKNCWKAINLMRSVWQQRPAQIVERARTGAALLREFELALGAGDATTAAARVAELGQRGLLSAENFRFLEIRQLASQGRWREIADAPDLGDIATIRRPWLVTEDLLTALYRARLRPYELAQDVAGAVQGAHELFDELPELFNTRGPLRSGDVTKLFVLHYAAPEHQDRARIEELGRGSELSEGDRDWISTIAQTLAPSEPPARDALSLLAAGDFDAAFDLARDDPPSRARAEILVECAFEIQTLESAQQAVDALDALGATERAQLLERRLLATAADHLRGLVEPPEATAEAVPQTWRSWLTRLLRDPEWNAADAVAECGQLEYSAEEILDPGGAQELAALMLEAADSSRRQAFRDALPRIVSWLERKELNPSITHPIHGAILTVLALDAVWGETSLEVAYNSTEALLRSDLDTGAYVELLEQLGLLWERMASRAHTAWLADILELLELYPGPQEPLVGFAATSVGRVLASIDRLDSAVAGGLSQSCSAIGAHELAEAIRTRTETDTPDEQEPADSLEGRLVGIYTLTPQVGVRARDAIKRRFPGVQVEIDSSKVSTPGLEHLAAAADYLIVSIRSAKHAATDAIERHRPYELPTLIPRGRGSSRMVEALVDAVAASA